MKWIVLGRFLCMVSWVFLVSRCGVFFLMWLISVLSGVVVVVSLVVKFMMLISGECRLWLMI